MNINFNDANFITSAYDVRNAPQERRPEIVMVGRSNVGKSSMINKLLNRKSIAKVSEKPGKTAAANYYDVGKKIYLVDLPGYGFALRSKAERRSWGSLTGDYFDSDRDIALVIFLIDIRHEPTEDDVMMYDFLMSREVPFCIAATKADKLSAKQIEEQIEKVSRQFLVRVIPFSSKDGKGVQPVREIIEDVTEEYLKEQEENKEE